MREKGRPQSAEPPFPGGALLQLGGKHVKVNVDFLLGKNLGVLNLGYLEGGNVVLLKPHCRIGVGSDFEAVHPWPPQGLNDLPSLFTNLGIAVQASNLGFDRDLRAILGFQGDLARLRAGRLLSDELPPEPLDQPQQARIDRASDDQFLEHDKRRSGLHRVG
jgi:hypothetical protein